MCERSFKSDGKGEIEHKYPLGLALWRIEEKLPREEVLLFSVVFAEDTIC